MRAIGIIAAGLLVAGCAPSTTDKPREEAPLKGFTFRGLVPGVTTVEDGKKLEVVEYCSKYETDKTIDSCSFKKLSIGDTYAGDSSVVFKNGKFDWFSFSPSPSSYDNLLVELTKVYGAPCAVSTKTLQNAMGATFSGDAARWCFIEGNLTLRRHSEQSSSSAFKGDLDFFTSHPEPEPVTYTADTL